MHHALAFGNPVKGVLVASGQRDETGEGSGPLLVDAKWAVAGGAFAALFAVAIMALVGRVGDYEARLLLQATVPTLRFLASSGITASATVLALMLTMLAVSAETEAHLAASHYQRIRQVSLMAVVTLIASITVLMVLTFPLEESDELHRFYNVVYYALLAASAVLGGMMVAMVLMLLNAIRELIRLFAPGGSSRITRDVD